MERCRFCFVEEKRDLFKDIFNNEQTDPSLVKIVEILTNLTINEDVPYTKMCCLNCFNNLIKFYRCRETILKTNRLLIDNNSSIFSNNDENDQIDDFGQSSFSDDDSVGLSNIRLYLESDCDNDDDDKMKTNSCDNKYCSKTEPNIKEFTSTIDIDSNMEQEDKSDLNEEKILNNDENNLEFEYRANRKLNRKCKKISNNFSYLENHQNKRYQSTVRNNKFLKNGNLQTHSLTHNGEAIHTDERPYQCNICHKTFTVKWKLQQHLLTHNGKSFQCNICKRKYSSERYLSGHIKIHTDGKPYQCNICDKTFETKSGLNRHVLKHNGEFHCHICQKKFINKCYLLTHIKIHTYGKPYQCNICDKTYTSKWYLQQHLLTHNGKSFQCNICKKKFSTKHYLSVHIKIHTDGKPYQRNICDENFIVKKPLST